eukprot:g7727.t1
MKPRLVGESAKAKFLTLFQDCYYNPDDIVVEEALGQGSFASVFKCKMKIDEDEKFVAVKKMDPSLFQEEQDVLDFFRETKLLASAHHPNILSFIGVTFGSLQEHSEESMCIIQECMNHGTLKTHIDHALKNDSNLTPKECLELMIGVGKGLVFLHDSNVSVIHRDIKPANILIHRDGVIGGLVAKLGDFGLSALLFDRKTRTTQNQHETKQLTPVLKKKMTFVRSVSTLADFADAFVQSRSKSSRIPGRGSSRSSALISSPSGTKEFYALTGQTGSLAYMAPEVFRNQQYNEKADVFSFAIVLYEALNLVHPFFHYMIKTSGFSRYQGEDVNKAAMEEYAREVSKGYRPILTAKWPIEISSILKKCWAQMPEDRPGMKSVILQLEDFYKNNATADLFVKKSGGCFCCGA